MTLRPLVVAALTTGALVAGGTTGLAAPSFAGPGADGGPQRVLDRTLAGPAALRTLGTHGLRRAAEANDMAAERLAHLLEDRTTRLTANGRVFYADVTESTTESTTSEPTPAAAQAAPLDRTFTLHSRPGSSRTIFLDFDGATVSDTWWNDPDDGGLPSTAVGAFDLDGDRSSFSDAERLRIQEVWARVAEDYAPFDVDVTTEAPASGGLTRSSDTDTTYGTHVLFAPGRSIADTLCEGTCSGVAWMDVFDQTTRWGVPGPAWVFPDNTNRSGWQLAEVASHEAGHTLALQHDGHNTSSYYTGRTPWGPIMGSSRYALTQFSKGDYSGANQVQDDLRTIAESGAPALGDDHRDSVATTTSTLGAAATGSLSGIIGNRGDRDVLRYDHGSCPVTVTVATSDVGPNLDVLLRVLDSSGNQLASANPAVTQPGPGEVHGTGATLTLPSRPAGTIYVEVDGVGQGDMPSSGYSDYGSVGRYTVSVEGCVGDGGGAGSTSPPQTEDPVATVPGQALIGRAYPGARGGKVTARATWSAPLHDGGSPVTGYRVTAYKVSLTGVVLRRTTWTRPASERSFTAALTKGLHRFRVVALNAEGAGVASALSNRVRAR